MTNTICFLDTETLGLDPMAPVWEFAAIRREEDGREEEFHAFFDHDVFDKCGDPWLESLAPEFAADYGNRYEEFRALKHGERAAYVYTATRGAHIVGAVPSFDTERLSMMMRHHSIMEPPWHYHLTDVENLVVGYLAGKGELMAPPWKSEDLSRAIGVEPDDFARHTATGDVRWVKAQWDAVMTPNG